MAKFTLLANTFLWLFVFSCFLIIPKGQAEVSPWVQTNGPSGGVINTIEIDPVHPDILYAGGAGGSVFKSIDGGATWTMLEQIVSTRRFASTTFSCHRRPPRPYTPRPISYTKVLITASVGDSLTTSVA